MARENKAKRDERRFGSPERLADRIPSSSWWPPFRGLYRDGPQREDWIRAVGWASDEISRSPVIVVDNVAEYVYSDSMQDTSWKDLPAIAPPFPQFFLEFNRPTLDQIHPKFNPSWTDGSPQALPDQVGCLFFVDDPEAMFETYPEWRSKSEPIAQDIDRAMIVFLMVRRKDLIVGPMATSFFLISREGKIGGAPLVNVLWEEQAETIQPSALLPYFGILQFPMIVSLSFMNCPNVPVEDHEPDRAINRERKKNGLKPFVRFDTINIDPMKEVLRTEGRIETEGLKRALHRCRGHFATFKDNFMGRPLDKPMTVWRPAHVRGSIKEGIVISDYNVKAPTGVAP